MTTNDILITADWSNESIYKTERKSTFGGTKLSCQPWLNSYKITLICETEHSKFYLQNGSDHKVAASYSGL